MGNHLPVTLKTSYADGPLCGFTTLFISIVVEPTIEQGVEPINEYTATDALYETLSRT